MIELLSIVRDLVLSTAWTGLIFCLGGLLGYVLTILYLVDCETRDKWPNSAKRRWWLFWGVESVVKLAEQAEYSDRRNYGLALLTTMIDIGGPGPWPKTREQIENLFSLAEMKFQAGKTEK